MDTTSLPLLILGYKRPSNLDRILRLAQEHGVKQIYVSLDGIVDFDSKSIEISKEIDSILTTFSKEFLGELIVNKRESNVGCAVSVITSIDWFFNRFDSGVILEDDCIPSQDFFQFARNGIELAKTDQRITLICGTQFAPVELESDEFYLSEYSLTWGWAITATNWRHIRKNMFKVPKFSSLLFENNPEKCFWLAGSRRALLGFTDVWDTPFLWSIRRDNRLVLLPKTNLVENIGGDEVATHNQTLSRWVGNQAGRVNTNRKSLSTNTVSDEWLRKNFYKIRFRHVYTTKINAVLDLVFRRPKFHSTLENRCNESVISI